MKPASEPRRVIDLSERQPSGERVGEILRSVRSIALARVRKLAASLFENIDDALFDLAEKAESNAVQTQYFDGMREVRKKRHLIERLFVDALGKAFGDFAGGTLAAVKPEVLSPQSENELSLVDDRELEESLAITSMVSKTENRFARAIYAVNQRLSVISGGQKVVDASNPIGPAILCQCFRQAMRELDAEVKVKLIIYKLFERYVLAGLDSLYEAVNVELIRAGVLPQLRHHAPAHRRGSPSSPAADSSGRQAADNNDADATASERFDEETGYQNRQELYRTLHRLLAERRSYGDARGGAGSSMSSAGSSAPALGPAELLGALTLLQTQSPPPPAVPTSPPEEFDAQLAVQRLKQELIAQLRQLNTGDKVRVTGADEDTIDLVGMLFEYILQDRNLPAQMQALLGRLQIPYLKVAILDKHLFAQKSHPARRLLDTLADTAKGWSPGSDHDHRLYKEVKEVVETLLREFDDDVDIFKTLLARFEKFAGSLKHRAQVAEQRAAEATRGRERLQSARQRAAREVRERVEDGQLPALIYSVLTRPWANYLVLTLLRQGEESPEWDKALGFIDDFAWSAQPVESDEQRESLRQRLPDMEKTLRHGLATVAFHENDVRRLMLELQTFYASQLQPDNHLEGLIGDETAGNGAARETSGEQKASELIPESVEDLVQSQQDQDSSPAEPVSVPDNADVERVRALKIGTWIEFSDGENTRERAKLSWISPISSKYLFVNRRGLKVCDKTVSELTAQLKDGSAVVLEEVPLFDRALDAIVERLKTAQQDRHPAQA